METRTVLAWNVEEALGQAVVYDVAPGGQALLVAARALQTDRPVVWLVPDDRQLAEREDEVRFWQTVLAAGDTDRRVPVISLPDYERTPFLLVETHPDVVSTRLRAWSMLIRAPRWVLILPVASAIRRVPPLTFFQGLAWDFRPGMEVPRDFLIELLVQYGYHRTDQVQQAGDFAVRGAIVDVFPPGHDDPVRMEFFDERLEELRVFDVETQRSKARLENLRVLPWVEFPLTPAQADRWFRRAAEVVPPKQWGPAWEAALEAWTERGRFPGYEDYLAWALESLHAWWDVFPAAEWVVSEPAAVDAQWEALYRHAEEAGRHALEQGIPAPDPWEWLTPPASWVAFRAEGRWAQAMTAESVPPSVGLGGHRLGWRTPTSYEGHLDRFLRDTQAFLRNDVRVVPVLSSRLRAERFQALLRERLMQAGPVVPPEHLGAALRDDVLVLTYHPLHWGLEAPDLGLWVVPEDAVFGRRIAVEVRHRVPLERAQAMDLSALRPGDYVVHTEHGIGRFIGLQRLQYGERSVETVAIEYAGGDRLYVPVDRLDLVRKYVGPSDEPPALDRLGGRTWQAKQRRARQAVEGILRELVELYATRQVVEGFAFPPDDDLQQAFEAAFPYELTPDQKRAIEEVKRDMERSRVMDRLLCGDVGFGKTEVAMRAAMKAVLGGKQVAVLVPTTVLAFQHYMTFTRRFAEFPVRIAMLSRLVPEAEQRSILQALKRGDIDIIIGTHRLLSEDVEFLDLGLIVIDEEQRFGVLQKERLKQLRREADVLSMTATPIPRTLQMALSGLMEISLIRTPPRDRLAVQTHVVHFSPEIIRSAIEHELRRGGQVYFVHNEVETLDRMAALVQDLCPMARVAVTHGQMPPRRLEDTMLRFMRGDLDVLVTTTIIENGVDIPNVNTLIVNNAHRFGLAQLYQLRGRVGRSYRRAYAYLMVPPMAELSEVARRRLAALREFTELGSGFRLAALDLELRGAGELLGRRQHGHIQALGLDAYIEVIRQAVAELKNEPYRPPRRTTLRLPVDAEIPDDYMPSERHRMYYYRALAEADTVERVEALAQEIRDCYGPLPEAVENLLRLARLRVELQREGVTELSVQSDALVLRLDVPDDARLQAWLRRLARLPKARVEPPDRVVLPGWPRTAPVAELVDWLRTHVLMG
jgi:transcription-repair coupling factor (superfamily II helicase)